MVGDKQIKTSLSPVASLEGAPLANKIYFDVPFEQKEAAKAVGLWWDSTIRRWYAGSAEVAEAFSLSVQGKADAPVETDRHYFKVPYLQKDHAKALGMRFDGIRKLWFAPSSALALEAARIFERFAE